MKRKLKEGINMLVEVLRDAIPNGAFDVALCAMISLRYALALLVNKTFITFKRREKLYD